MRVEPIQRETGDIETQMLVLLLPAGRTKDSLVLMELDRRMEGSLSKQLTQERFEGLPDQRVFITPQGKIKAQRLLLMGCQAGHLSSIEHLRALATEAAVFAQRQHLGEITVIRQEHDSLDPMVWAEVVADGVKGGTYRFDKYKSKKEKSAASLERLILATEPGISPQVVKDMEQGASRGLLMGSAVEMAKNLVNESPDRLFPQSLAMEAKELCKIHELQYRVLTAADCSRLGMRLFLSVARGSRQPPAFIHMVFHPDNPPAGKIVLVGKGITFDSGGLSLKSAAAMQDMKTDMAGAASVLAAMTLMRPFGVGWEVHALVPAAENMPSGGAVRVGEVVQGMDGTYVEISNTDAEGRLTLADAFSYGRRLKPDIILDLATLTGSSMVALGKETAAVMGRPRELVDRWMAASERAGEPCWPMPLLEGLEEDIKSTTADIKNSGQRWGAAITAGLFLKRFARDTDFLHIDIAGPAFRSKGKAGRPSGATGYGTRTLMHFLTTESK